MGSMVRYQHDCEEYKAGEFTVLISESMSEGCFFHNDEHNDCQGNLDFEGKQLHAYTGVSYLPHSVANKLTQLGYDLDHCITDR